MINRDGGVWRLSWERTQAGFRAWVSEHPHIAVEGERWIDVEEALIDAVDKKLHAGEWAPDWEPPPPEFATFYRRSDSHLALIGNDWWCCRQSPDELYCDGRCTGCHRGLGERTATPIEAGIEGPAHICIPITRPDRFALQGLPDLWSEELVDALLPAERATADWRPAQRIGRGRRQYLEPVPHAVIRPVGVNTEAPLSGYRCAVCGHMQFSYEVGPCVYEEFYHLQPGQISAPAFWIENNSPSLCIRTDRWKELRASRKWRGVITDSLNLVGQECLNEDVGMLLRQGWNS